MVRLRSPIKWFGGKGKMSAKILPVLEEIEHRIYVEPFGGGASILIAKSPKPVEVYNDLDLGLYDFFRVLCDTNLFEQFHRRVVAAPYHREAYDVARATWRDTDDLIERVSKWFVVARQSFGGRFGAGFGTTVSTSRRGMAETASKFLSAIDKLPEVSERLRRVQIENLDWRVVIDRYDTQDTLFYVDPPYIAATRKSGKYAHEMTDDDHRDLVEKLLVTSGSWVLSGYASELYRPLERAGARRIDYQTACYAAGRTRATGMLGDGAAKEKQKTVECLWVMDRRKAQTEFNLLFDM